MEKSTVTKLPLGFRFRPTDEELITHYLRLKINGRHSHVQIISEIDVCKWEPWDLPELSVIKSDDPEWFFFCPRERKYLNGHRSNRATEAGYWKATGKDRNIKSRKSSSGGCATPHLVGIKKTLVFYKGRAPKGERTNWIMHEYRPTEPDLEGNLPGQAPFVLCRLFRKPVEKAASSMYDEVENSYSSPATTKSSSDNTSSKLFQEQAGTSIQMKEQSEGIQMWLTDKVENTTPKTSVHGDSCTSEVQDHPLGEASEHYSPQINDLMYQGLPYGQNELHVFPTLEQFNQLGVGHVDSPYADDFANDLNGVHFQDGTGELDVSFTELLDVFGYEPNNLASQKYSDFGMKNSMNVNSDQGSTGNSIFMGDGLNDDTNADMQIQPIQAHRLTYEQELKTVCMHAITDHPFREEASSTNLFDSSSDEWGRPNASHATDFTDGPGIVIRQRKVHNRPYSDYSMPQGTAPRRIRLQVDFAPTSAPTHSCYSDEKRVSVVSEVGSNTNCSSVSDEPEVTSISQDRNKAADKCNGIVRQHAKAGGGGVYGSANKRPFCSSVALYKFPRSNFPKVYVLVYLTVVLSLVFTGIWKCRSFMEYHIC